MAKTLTPRDSLHAALKRAMLAVPKRGTIPALTWCKLAPANGGVTICTTDEELAYSETVPNINADLPPAGVAVDCAALLTAIAALQAGSVDLVVAGDRLVVGDSSLALQPIEDIPPQVIGAHELPKLIELPTMAWPDIGPILLRVGHAMSDEETRYYLNGIFLHTRENEPGLHFCATDGHRLAYDRLPDVIAGAMPNVIVPAPFLKNLHKWLAKYTGSVAISVSDTRIRIVTGTGIVIASKLIDGTFPEYQRIVPARSVTSVHFDASATQAFCKRALAIRKNGPVRITPTDDGFTLDAHSEDGDTRAAAPFVANRVGETDWTCGVNARYLGDMMAASGDALAWFGDAEGKYQGECPIRVESRTLPDFIGVIMPVRVPNG